MYKWFQKSFSEASDYSHGSLSRFISRHPNYSNSFTKSFSFFEKLLTATWLSG